MSEAQPTVRQVLALLSRKRLLRLADELLEGVDRSASSRALVELLAAESRADTLLLILERLNLSEWRQVCARLEIEASELLELARPPVTRGECEAGPRPCPWTNCRYHLAPDRDPARRRGSSTLAPTTTCVLDFADRGGATSEEVSREFGVSHQRIRQIEVTALRGLSEEDRAVLEEFVRP